MSPQDSCPPFDAPPCPVVACELRCNHQEVVFGNDPQALKLLRWIDIGHIFKHAGNPQKWFNAFPNSKPFDFKW